ncbi:MAG: hypothetical protein WCJ03_04665 [Bacteroidales bacterium]
MQLFLFIVAFLAVVAAIVYLVFRELSKIFDKVIDRMDEYD